MIALIRNYFCSVDPTYLTIGIGIGICVITVTALVGLGKLLLSILLSCIITALVFVIGFGVYKIIVWAQSRC